jgi:hypothetical protein
MVRRRLLLVLLLGVLAAGGAAVTWQARGQARLVERDLTAARDLLGEAGGFSAGELEDRLVLVDRAEDHALAAQRRLGLPPLRLLGALPLLGRDVRVARAVTASAVGTVRSTGSVVTALQPIQTGHPTRATILRASGALLGLHDSLEADLERVRAARPLLATGSREDYLAAATSASATAERAGQALKLAADMYGPQGTARWFLAFQNPAELRGTGGLIGEYGILESSSSGPRLVEVAPYQVLDAQTRTGVGLPKGLAGRYERLGVDRAWSAVNIPPDMPTVGGIATKLYREATGDRIDGVIALDPLAVAQILEAGGPIRVDGIRLTPDNVAQETLVQAYIRYADDNNARKRFLRQAAVGAFDAFRRALARRPVELMQGLATAARGRHVQVYSADPAGQRALVGLGVGGSAAAPVGGDYLMAVGINAGGNKLDAFLRRTLRWRVRLAADGSARATASLVLRNTVPRAGMPRYIVGPYDRRFRKGVNEQIQTLYVAGRYGFSRASVNGRQVGAEAQAELGGLALTQPVGVPAGEKATISYQLTRPAAAEPLPAGRLRYRLVLRPQATIWPDQARVSVAPPEGWEFTGLPTGASTSGQAAIWSGTVDQERELVFLMRRR